MTGRVLKPSPMSMGVPKSAREVMNTISAADRMVGMMTGSVTCQMRLKPCTPRLSLASSREESKFCSAVETYMYT